MLKVGHRRSGSMTRPPHNKTAYNRHKIQIYPDLISFAVAGLQSRFGAFQRDIPIHRTFRETCYVICWCRQQSTTAWKRKTTCFALFGTLPRSILGGSWKTEISSTIFSVKQTTVEKIITNSTIRREKQRLTSIFGKMQEVNVRERVRGLENRAAISRNFPNDCLHYEPEKRC